MKSRPTRHATWPAAVLALALLAPALAPLKAPAAPVAPAAPSWAAAARRPVRLAARAAAPAPARLDSRLAYLAPAAAASRAALAAAADAAGVTLLGERVTVAVDASEGRGAAERAIASAGGRVTGVAGTLLRADVPAARLSALAYAPGVGSLRPPLRPVPAAVPAVSQGVRITDADAWHAEGVTGAGVKVGVIDVGFRGYAPLRGSYLPSSVATWPAAAPPANESPHGTAVAEVVHDVAPGASLYLARVADEFDLAAAADWMHANGVSVVTMSLTFLGEPTDGGRTPGANTVDAVVATAVGRGIFWANAGGDLRRRHWYGNFVDRDRDFALDWGGGPTNLNTFRHAGGVIRGVLTWGDPWANAKNDYDLVLLHWNPDLPDVDTTRGSFESILDPATESANRQWGLAGDHPHEEVYWTGGKKGDIYAWAVVNMRPWATTASGSRPWLPGNSPAVDFDFFSPGADLGVARATRSISTPADNESDGFMAVAAIQSAWTWDPGHVGFGQAELASAEGPNRRGAHTVRISAPDGVSNYVAGLAPPAGLGGPFAGTSAASPHVAGAAALLKERFGYTATQTAAAIRAAALDLGVPGLDDRTGYGALRLPAVTTPTVDVERVAGPDRYRTAIEVSRSTFGTGSVQAVVLATGLGFADAISGSGLAGSYRGPLLLTPPAGVTPELVAELKRLGATQVTVLGSEASVSAAVVTQLQTAGFVTERLGGKTRYDTAALVARRIALREGAAFRREAFVVSGSGFADALSVAPYAWSRKLPVLPVERMAVPPAVASAIASIGVGAAIVAGDDRAVGADAVSALARAGVGSVRRVAGPDRYATAKAVQDYASGRGWADWGWVGVASGANYPDALGGAAAVGAHGGMLVLSPPAGLGALAKASIEASAAEMREARLFGGGKSLEGAVQLGVLTLTGN